jgi:hypothetical protein
MYPFGPKQNDNEVPEDDKYGWMCLELRKKIPAEGIEFYGRRHKSLSVRILHVYINNRWEVLKTNNTDL